MKILSIIAMAIAMDSVALDSVIARVDSLVAPVDSVVVKADSVAKDTAKGFVFTTIDSVPITSVKDQFKSGTCWAFSGLGFFEAELLRMGQSEIDLSEMYVVSKTMMDRAQYCVRMYGDVKFAGGGSAYDVLYCLDNYGFVPQYKMPGIQYGTTKADTLPVHQELDALMGGYVKALTTSGIKRLTPVWTKGFQSLLDTYLGQCPDTFTIDGELYSPKTYAESLGLDASHYVSLTSFTHHPFYSKFAVEVPDNWRLGMSYNLPLDEMMEVVDFAIANGYTMVWAADVSEEGFSRKGIGQIPEEESVDVTGSDMAKWLGLTSTEKKKKLTAKPLPEKVITQELRQQGFDNWETTDDHGMVIFGIAKDQNGKKYYMVKNSWGTVKSDYKGIWYVTEAFVRYKTINLLINKNAIPEPTKRKLGIH